MFHGVLNPPLPPLIGLAALLLLSLARGQTAEAPAAWRTYAHSHNDYQKRQPLLGALRHGARSVEVDVLLVDGALQVAHDARELAIRRKRGTDGTLSQLYLEPLARWVREHGGRVHASGPPFLLLVDVKTEAEPTWRAIRAELRRFSGMLTRVERGRVHPGAVTVVLSGNRARQAVLASEVRLVGLDGRPSDLESELPAHAMPLLSERWSKLFRWGGEGPMPATERRALRSFVARAHARGRRVRFWATPENGHLWRELLLAGVDLVNTDRMPQLARYLEGARAQWPLEELTALQLYGVRDHLLAPAEKRWGVRRSAVLEARTPGASGQARARARFEGPGVLVTVEVERPVGKLAFLVDGADAPALEVDLAAAIAGKAAVAPDPLPLRVGDGGLLPILVPYQHALELRYRGPPNDLRHVVRRWPEWQPVRSLDADSAAEAEPALEHAVRLALDRDRGMHLPLMERLNFRALSLEPGQGSTILDLDLERPDRAGAPMGSCLSWLALDRQDADAATLQALGRLELSVAVDGASTIERVPFAAFLGWSGSGDLVTRGATVRAKGLLGSRRGMPFRRRLEVRLHHPGSERLEVRLGWGVRPLRWTEHTWVLRATFCPDLSDGEGVVLRGPATLVAAGWTAAGGQPVREPEARRVTGGRSAEERLGLWPLGGEEGPSASFLGARGRGVRNHEGGPPRSCRVRAVREFALDAPHLAPDALLRLRWPSGTRGQALLLHYGPPPAR